MIHRATENARTPERLLRAAQAERVLVLEDEARETGKASEIGAHHQQEPPVTAARKELK